jgi:hypothetical protein
MGDLRGEQSSISEGMVVNEPHDYGFLHMRRRKVKEEIDT